MKNISIQTKNFGFDPIHIQFLLTVSSKQAFEWVVTKHWNLSDFSRWKDVHDSHIHEQSHQDGYDSGYDNGCIDSRD